IERAALHVQGPHQSDSATRAVVGYVGSRQRSLRTAADLSAQRGAGPEQRAHDPDDTRAVVRSRHRSARISEPHSALAISARRRTLRRRLLVDPYRERTDCECRVMSKLRAGGAQEDPNEPAPNRKKEADDTPLTFWQIAGSTVAAAFGVQKRANRERDFTRGKPMQFIIAGIVFTTLFVLAIVTVVQLVLRNAS